MTPPPKAMNLKMNLKMTPMTIQTMIQTTIQKTKEKPTVSKRPPLALSHPRKPCRETLFAARIRMTGRRLTAPIARSAVPAQPAAPPKPKPDADGRIWHPRPGYPDQEISEPDAQGRVQYKIYMTTPASQLPPRKTDAQRAADLIYRSVIKKYGNP